ncbi:MAG: type II secretion system protein N [Oleiphilus sp.]
MLINRLPLITAICLVAMIAGALYWQLSPYVQAYFKDPAGFKNFTQAATSVRPSRTSTTEANDVRRQYNISNFKLFGDAKAPVKQAPIETETLPETTLRLTLTGVLAGKDNIQASALIEGPDRQTRSYRVDEAVPGGAILKQVYPDRVVLERSGRLENLIFEEKRPLGIESQARRPDPEPDNDAEHLNQRPSISSSQNIQQFNQQQTQQIKDRLSRLRNRLQNSGP